MLTAVQLSRQLSAVAPRVFVPEHVGHLLVPKATRARSFLTHLVFLKSHGQFFGLTFFMMSVLSQGVPQAVLPIAGRLEFDY